MKQLVKSQLSMGNEYLLVYCCFWEKINDESVMLHSTSIMRLWFDANTHSFPV